MTTRRRGGRAAALLLVILINFPIAAAAQRYAFFRGPSPEDTLRLQRSRFEDAWNDLFAAELIASAAGHDSAASLRSLESRAAEAERKALHSSIARTALKLRGTWSREEARARAQAWQDEKTGWGLRESASSSHARALLMSAAAVYERLGDTRRQAWAAGRLGGVAIAHREFADAYGLQIRALALRRLYGDSGMVANTLNDLGGISLNLHRPREAIAWLAESRRIRDRLEDPRIVETLDRIGTAYSRMGETDSSFAAFRSALALGASGRPRIDLLLNYADALRRAAHLRAAEDTLRLAATLAEEGGFDDKHDDAVSRASDVAIDAGRFTDAIELRRHLVERATATGDSLALARAKAARGNAWLAARMTSQARRDLVEAARLAVEFGDSTLLGQCQVDLALAASLDGDSTLAWRRGRTARQIALAMGNESLLHDANSLLGGLAFDAGRMDEAIHWHEAALLHSGDASGSASLSDRMNLAVAHMQKGALALAESELSAIAAAADSAQLFRIAPEARANLAHVAWRREQYLLALAQGRENITRLEALRQRQQADDPLVSLFADHADEFDAMIEYLIRAQRIYPDSAFSREAFDWAERSRARVLLDHLGGRRGQPTLGIRDVQVHLADDEALIEFSAGDSMGVAWVVRSDTMGWMAIPNRHALAIRVQQTRGSLQSTSLASGMDARRRLGELGALLLAGLAPWLSGAKHLIIVPDGPLASLPFECLVVGGRYLIQDYTVAYSSSASVRFTQNPPTASRLIVALGDPNFGTEGTAMRDAPEFSDSTRGMTFGRLPFTALEVATLRGLAAGRPIVTLTGSRATREQLLAVPGLAHASILHLATHGIASNDAPERSSLWFAPDSLSGTPGRLTAIDVSALELGIDLVALAACESGLGRLERGEGVIGLTRAFQLAGARSVLASLWKVSDGGSARLLSEFYAALLGRRASRRDALALAKRSMLQSPTTSSPFYWAPFVLVGEDGPLGDAR